MSWKVLSLKTQFGQLRFLSTCRIVCGGWKNFSLDDELTREVKDSIEKKWQNRVYGPSCPAEHGKELNPPNPGLPSRYILPMFPYPSGRLHLGHVRVYTLSDVLGRYHRMQGNKVIHPMGWDAFGLPAENAARDHGIDAEKWTRDNIKNMKDQIIQMGCCFDWDREFATCDPSYYKWTQWLFTELWRKGLAYKKRAYVYWDPVDKTVLAEEQVDSDMRSWRSGAKVEKKLLQQWFIKTAVFAEKLTEGLTSGKLKMGWRDVVALQKHWIGEIKGYFTDSLVDVKDLIGEQVNEGSALEPIRIWFQTPESLKNAKCFILQHDHFLLKEGKSVKQTLSNGYKVMNFTLKNPATGKELPVISGPMEQMPWIPGSCDCRVIPESLDQQEYPDSLETEAFVTEILEIVDSLPNIKSESSTSSPTEFQYHPASLRLRDWLISRQRRWGTPIPAINCLDCGHSSAVEPQKLPVTSTSEKSDDDKCSHCGSSNIQMETDTLDTFFDSSWYFFRFLDSQNEAAIFDTKFLNPLPVHTYVGGKEHATLHLYYARFMTQFLHSIGLSPVTEPFEKLIPIGMVLGEACIVKGSGKYVKRDDCETDESGKKLKYKESGEPIYTKWEKMSKSKYNGIDPDSVLQEYGIDTTRLLTMAEAAPTSPRKWPPNNIEAFTNWQRKLWLLLRQFVDAKDFGELVFVDDEVWQKSESEIFDNRNFYLKGINHDYAVTSQISVVISKLQAMLGYLRKVPKTYHKDSIEFERCLGAALICLYPIMPAFSAQLWQSFRDVATFTEPEFSLDHEVWEQQWPQVDWRYQLDLICRIHGEEFIAKVERNYLDTMDPTTAMQIALDIPQLRERISSASPQCEIVSFTVEPGFRGMLTLREKRNNDNDNAGGTTPPAPDSNNQKRVTQ